MKDYEHWDFCNKATHAVGWPFRNVSIVLQSQWWQGRPSPSATTWGRCAEGTCQSSLQSSQRHRQTGSKVLMLQGLRNLPKAG